MSEDELRQQIIDTALLLSGKGLNRGASGNLSVRFERGFLITPTGLPADEMEKDDIVVMGLDGRHQGACRPSSEWRFHRDIYAAREDVHAIVHTHSTFATTLACMGKDVPAFHYMVAAAGGRSIRCAPYATFGTQLLSDYALAALESRLACLLGNHGLIVVGATLKKTVALTIEVESLCEQYWRTLQVNGANLLSDEEMDRVLLKFNSYGQQAG
jgi:L-fuculose-phosphate aldolase